MSFTNKNHKKTPQINKQTTETPILDNRYCICCKYARKKSMIPRNLDFSKSYAQFPKWQSIEEIDDSEDTDTEDTLTLSDEDSFIDDDSETLSYDSDDDYVPPKKKKCK